MGTRKTTWQLTLKPTTGNTVRWCTGAADSCCATMRRPSTRCRTSSSSLLRREKDLVHSAPSSLLYTIATNVCLNRIRSSKRRPETRDDEILLTIAGDDGPEEQTLSNHFLDRLFKREPESTRTIAVLHYVDGLTLEETAQQVGMSVSGVPKASSAAACARPRTQGLVRSHYERRARSGHPDRAVRARRAPARRGAQDREDPTDSPSESLIERDNALRESSPPQDVRAAYS